MFKHVFNAYLAFAFSAVPTVLGLAQIRQNSAHQNTIGIFAQICGTGRSIVISLNDDEPPQRPDHKSVACHAICAERELSVEEDT